MTDSYCPGCQSTAGEMGCPDHNPTIQRTDLGMERKQPFKCPVCDGQGSVSRPSWIAGDVTTWIDSKTSHPCHACNEKGIVWG